MAENAITQKFHATENYVALHVHSDGSVLDGFSTIPDIVNRTIELGQPAVAVTDHGSLFNIYELYKQATAAGVKPILGLEAYMAPSPISHTIHEPYFFSDGGSDDVSAKGAYTHITLWAYNNIGLKNLFKLSYLSYAEGYYKKTTN